jgi:D-3-phosphoglycerate dehydrogenase
MATHRILLTTTSYQDTPGKHHEILAASGFEVVRARGPLAEQKMLELVKSGEGFDGFLNGDDIITAGVINAALAAPRRLKVIAKYGIGLDSIDVKHATAKRIPVLFTPGVNHTTVAEHAIGLMICLAKHFYPQLESVKSGQWKRMTGNELFGKTLAILGMGRIGKELAKRARAFEMNVKGYDLHWDEGFAQACTIERCTTAEDALANADVVSLHMNLDENNRGFINKTRLAAMKKGALLINTARGGLVVEQDVADACRSGQLGGYGADVLEHEPIQAPHPFQELQNVLITPHVGSRTFESVERQAMRATLNIVNYLNGEKDFIQANTF